LRDLRAGTIFWGFRIGAYNMMVDDPVQRLSLKEFT